MLKHCFIKASLAIASFTLMSVASPPMPESDIILRAARVEIAPPLAEHQCLRQRLRTYLLTRWLNLGWQ